jgi:hypothetical protein
MFVEYGDVVLAAALAVVVAVEVIFFSLEGDKLTEATAALLGILSFALVRERWTRRKGLESFDAKLADVQGKAAAVEQEARTVSSTSEAALDAANETRATVTDALRVLAGAKPYDVLWSRFSWEMESCNGSHATAKTVRDLRFTADNIYCIYEHSQPTGKSSVGDCWGKVDGQPWRKLPVMHKSFPGPQNKQFTVISLEGFMMRGDRMRVEAPRELEDSFTGRRESVKVNVLSPTDKLEVEVVWPAACNLRSLRVERTGSTKLKVPWDVDDLEPIEGDRRRLVYDVDKPVLDDAIFVIWEWDGAAADTSVEAGATPAAEA